jgi:hypothetical protein
MGGDTMDGVWISELDLLITYIHHMELHITDRWHIQTSAFSRLQSLLAGSWQRLLPRKVLQLLEFRPSSHCRPCRTLVNWQLNQLGHRLAAILHQPPSLLFPGWLSTDSWQLNSAWPTSYFASLHSTDNWTLSLTNQLLHVISLNWQLTTELSHSPSSYFTSLHSPTSYFTSLHSTDN